MITSDRGKLWKIGDTRMKSLEEMTLQELWMLFPIVLVEHKDCWNDWAVEEIARLKELLGDRVVAISHIGSTAIKDIWAKPIMDILMEVGAGIALSEIKSSIIAAGYRCMSETANRISFNKGYTPEGFADKVFHLHLHYAGDNDEIYFRDYLNAHREIAVAYESLKMNLWKRFEYDRDGYTAAKTDFVARYTNLAKSEL